MDGDGWMAVDGWMEMDPKATCATHTQWDPTGFDFVWKRSNKNKELQKAIALCCLGACACGLHRAREVIGGSVVAFIANSLVPFKRGTISGFMCMTGTRAPTSPTSPPTLTPSTSPHSVILQNIGGTVPS